MISYRIISIITWCREMCIQLSLSSLLLLQLLVESLHSHTSVAHEILIYTLLSLEVLLLLLCHFKLLNQLSIFCIQSVLNDLVVLDILIWLRLIVLHWDVKCLL